MICEYCNKEFEKGTKRFCWACYRGIRKHGDSYKKKIYKRDLINTKCQKCKKIRETTQDVNGIFCRKCYIKELYLKNPEYHEKFKKLCRDGKRKLAGIDLSLPLLNAPAGSGYIGPNGYKKICRLDLRGHPNADKKGRMFEHTYVMSQYLNRPLRKGELVHHKNGIRHDNRIENLELCHIGQPMGQRVEDKVKWCIEFLNSYGYDVIKK